MLPFLRQPLCCNIDVSAVLMCRVAGGSQLRPPTLDRNSGFMFCGCLPATAVEACWSHFGECSADNPFKLYSCLLILQTRSKKRVSKTKKQTFNDSSQELNLIDCIDTSMDVHQAHKHLVVTKTHKRERTLAKRGKRMAALASSFGHPYAFSPVPFHGHYNNRSLGIQAHSMSHKLISYNGFGSPYGQINWSRLPFDQLPAIGKLSSMENFHLQQPHQMMMDPSVNVRSNYIGIPSTNIGKILVGSPITLEQWKDDGGLLSTNQEEQQKHKLDLSLKL
ncbi:hypothetical protein HID58_023430 [Brassica napus]|uniref:Uncharacterized protein n=1 Tax=Brassica napus TaxID=3708 RepID=A0ABQ8D244_BRANA|nr:hypothetical protein HID58_023430 [Brassica napus]